MFEKDVLIVDDEPGVRELLAGALQDSGYAVDCAGTAAEAKTFLRQCRYRMVVADWRLPDGDGSTIANLAAGAGSNAFVMSGYLPRMLPGNVDPKQTIMKPVRPSELLAAARACIGKPKGLSTVPG